MDEALERKTITRVLKELARPVDFQTLIGKGIVKKSGAWYIVLKPKYLPSHAKRQAVAMESGQGGMLKLRFGRGTNKTAQKIFKKVTGRQFSG